MNKILDPCSGSRMFYFDRTNPAVTFGDIRNESHELCDGRTLNVTPDIEMDFRNLPFPAGQFKLVVFDPPHFVDLGSSSWMAKKYGVLNKSWRDDIRQGFAECFRVLEPDGVLVFKWNEYQVKLSEVLSLTDAKPLFGNVRPHQSKTHWLLFMKGAS